MKKRNAVIAIVLSIVLSVSITFTFTNIIQIKTNDRVILSKEDYETLIELQEKYSKIEELKDYISSNYYLPVDDSTFEEAMIKGMFESLKDPYSVYFNKKEFKDFNEQTSGKYAGIGVYVTINDDNLIEVISPIEGTPSERAGLKPKDKIIKVNGMDVSKENYQEAIDIMKGEPGTDVTITIARNGIDPFDVVITREIITIKAVTSKVLEGNIGYIRIKSFDTSSHDEFKEHLNKLNDMGIKGLIIDLRNNPGGSLYSVDKIADMLLGEQIIVYTEDRGGHKEYYNSDPKKVNLPIAVLVNGGSASASEILTGAIKDSNSGIIIGTQTYGKGVVQTVNSLDDGTGFKLTTSQYFTPNGNNINKVGITPDIVIEFDENAEDDNQLNKAIEVIKEKIK